MDIETITKLIDAGYTKADIEAMEAGGNTGADNGQQAGGEESEAGGKDNAQAGKEQGEASSKNESALIAELTKTVAGLQDTIKAMQTGAAEKAKQTTPTTDKIKEAMDNFINTL